MVLVRGPLASADAALPACAIRVDRLKLAKRLWRANADDGTDFGFELTAPLQHGDAVHATATARYVIEQMPEPVLEIALDEKPETCAVLGWIVGNLHFVIEARADRLLAPDDPALRQSLERLGIPFRATNAVFQPHRLAAAVAHSHAPATEHPFVRPAR
jgi:urease accessory protein